MASDEKNHRFSFLHRLRSKNSEETLAPSVAPPSYTSGKQLEKQSTRSSSNNGNGTDGTDGDDVDDVFDDTASTLPAYDSLPTANAPPYSSFHHTLQLQLDTLGKASGSAAYPTWGMKTEPDPTCIYLVHNNRPLYEEQPALLSVRKKRSSNSCTLVTGANYGHLIGRPGQLGNDQITIGTTVYRIGPGRSPRVALFTFDQQVHQQLPELVVASDKEPAGTPAWDIFEIVSKSIFNRVQTLRTRLGTFEWRYATRAERKALSQELIAESEASFSSGGAGAGAGATVQSTPTPEEITKTYSVNNLMVLERIVEVYGSMDHRGQSAIVGKPQKMRQTVARLIRSQALRTPGSSSYSAGNGGRLQMDLSDWTTPSSSAAGDKKPSETDREMAIALIVTSCQMMLKREVDRRRDQELAAVV
ncbi:hypothetical protein SCUCBS95973_005229 [Sporothrix curviconia]|uniref:Uncharacterized protein n=1 Tax=Sporothrix curviconia TaxID=1260050 RepID=A0ABP0BVH5_9PEZI